MSSHKLPNVIEFASLLSYVPERWWRHRTLSQEQMDEFKMGREYMIALKRDYAQPHGILPIYDSVARWCADYNLFPDFFTKDVILVPVPGSMLTKPDTLWVPKLLAEALVRRRLGSSVSLCLSRVASVPKSATSRPQDRATPARHCETMEIRHMITKPTSILLVDDLVTRGSTLLGAACRIAELYPDVNIKAFAAMRAVSGGDEFNGIMDPCTGTIVPTRNGRSRRRP